MLLFPLNKCSKFIWCFESIIFGLVWTLAIIATTSSTCKASKKLGWCQMKYDKVFVFCSLMFPCCLTTVVWHTILSKWQTCLGWFSVQDHSRTESLQLLVVTVRLNCGGIWNQTSEATTLYIFITHDTWWPPKLEASAIYISLNQQPSAT